MKISDDMLMAYADGELDPADAARVEAAIAADPELAAAVARHRALRQRLDAAFAPVLDEPVPARLLAAARGEKATGEGADRDQASDSPMAGPRVADLRTAARTREARRARRWSWPEWGAMAASLAIGALAAQLWRPAAPTAELAIDAAGGMQARGALAAALNTRLASEQRTVGEVAVGLSFRAGDGEYCRSFVLRRERTLSGLACRTPGGWQVPVLSESATEPEGELRQASSQLPAAVLAEIDARIDGEPLDAAAERAARDAGWR